MTMTMREQECRVLYSYIWTTAGQMRLGSMTSRGTITASSAKTRMTTIRPVTPTAATAPRSRRTRPRIPSAPGIPIVPAVPRIPTVADSELKDADPADEPLHVVTWLFDTSILHLDSRVCCCSQARQ